MNLNFSSLKNKQGKNKNSKAQDEANDLFGGLTFETPTQNTEKKAPANNDLDNLIGNININPNTFSSMIDSNNSQNEFMNSNINQQAPPQNSSDFLYQPSDSMSYQQRSSPNIPQYQAAAPPPPTFSLPQSSLPINVDSAQKFHTQLIAGLNQIFQEFIQVHGEENDITKRLSQLEEVKQTTKKLIIENQEKQNNALLMEDYNSADVANQSVEINRKKLEELENQKIRGVLKQKETQIKKAEKLERGFQLFNQNIRSLDQVVRTKEVNYQLNMQIESTRLKETHSREYLKNSSIYSTFQEKTDLALQQNKAIHSDVQSKIAVLEGQIYNETYQENDMIEAEILKKREIDDKIAELERQLLELRAQSNESQQIIQKCEFTINNTRKNYTVQLNPLQFQLKRTEEENKRILADLERAKSMSEQLTQAKEQNDELEIQKDKEIVGLKEENELIMFFVQKFQEIAGIYGQIAKKPENQKILEIRRMLVEKKQQHETQLFHRRQLDEKISAEREKMQFFESNIPLWEEQKKNSVLSKNYNLAGKLSSQIKKAQTDLESVNLVIQQYHLQLAQDDNAVQMFLSEIDNMQEDLEREESIEELSKADNINTIIQHLQSCLNRFDICSNVEEAFKNSIVEILKSLIELFENQMNLLYSNSGLSTQSTKSFNQRSAYVPRPIPVAPAAVVPKMTKEEVISKIEQLNLELERASSEENYELCEKLQNEIDKLNTQL